MTDDMIAVGSIPLDGRELDYDDADGKIVLHVREGDNGRTVFLSIKLYGEFSRAYEVRYDDFASVITKMIGDVVIHDAADQFNELLVGEKQ